MTRRTREFFGVPDRFQWDIWWVLAIAGFVIALLGPVGAWVGWWR